MHTALRPSIASCKSQGILTLCPSAAALAIALGPTNPWLINIAKETLVFRREGILTPIVVTCANILTSKRSSVGHPLPSQQMRILSYHSKLNQESILKKIRENFCTIPF